MIPKWHRQRFIVVDKHRFYASLPVSSNVEQREFKNSEFCFRKSLLSRSNLREGQTLLEEVHPVWLQPAHQTGHAGDRRLQVTRLPSAPAPSFVLLHLQRLHNLLNHWIKSIFLALAWCDLFRGCGAGEVWLDRRKQRSWPRKMWNKVEFPFKVVPRWQFEPITN